MQRFFTCKEYFKALKAIKINPMTAQQHFIGLDVGTKFVGVAVSDAKNKEALPYSIIDLTKLNTSKTNQELTKLCQNYMVQAIVVGIPKSHPHMIRFIEHWINQVWDVEGQDNYLANVPVITQDESLTTNESYEDFAQVNISEGYRSRINKMNKADKTTIDKMSAAVILQRALDKMNKYS
jgi:putative transcription antitermination factor YqgF